MDRRGPGVPAKTLRCLSQILYHGEEQLVYQRLYIFFHNHPLFMHDMCIYIFSRNGYCSHPFLGASTSFSSCLPPEITGTGCRDLYKADMTCVLPLFPEWARGEKISTTSRSVKSAYLLTHLLRIALNVLSGSGGEHLPTRYSVADPLGCRPPAVEARVRRAGPT